MRSRLAVKGRFAVTYIDKFGEKMQTFISSSLQWSEAVSGLHLPAWALARNTVLGGRR
jgi:hypothetical protein